jgi:hypothetical protein
LTEQNSNLSTIIYILSETDSASKHGPFWNITQGYLTAEERDAAFDTLYNEPFYLNAEVGPALLLCYWLSMILLCCKTGTILRRHSGPRSLHVPVAEMTAMDAQDTPAAAEVVDY